MEQTHELKCSNSFWKFLNDSENRIACFIRRANNYSHSSRYAWRSKLMLKYPLDVNYLTLRNDGTISYLPKGKEHVTNEDGSWSRDNRQNGAPARVIRKLLTPNALKLFKDSEFESLVNAYKAECDRENKTFHVYENTRIPEVYDMARESDRGSLGGSCMNNDTAYLDIYKECPHLRIVVLLNGCGELAGRALLWQVDKDTTLMDRIYTNEDHYFPLFLAYANSHGWIHKVEYNTYSDKRWFEDKDGNRFNRTFTIHTGTDFRYYPYIDTFSYGGDGYLTNECTSSEYYEYVCTGGGREEMNRAYCEHSGEYYDEDDLHYIERGRYAGSSIHRDYTVYCESDNNYYFEKEIGNILFEYNGDYYRLDDDNFVEVDGDMVHTDDARYCDLDDTYYYEYDCVYSNHHSTYIPKSEAYEVDGEYFHESVVNKVC